MKTYIENGTVIAWRNGRHEVIQGGVVVIEGDTILEVGEMPTCAPAEGDQRLDARGRIVAPGFVNTHAHATDTLYTKGYLEESTNISANAKETNYGTLYKTLPAVRHAIDPEAQVIAAECALAELARTGSTTVVELGYDYEVGGDGDIAITEAVAETAMRVGLRCYSAPRFRAMHYGFAPGGKVWYEHYPENGRKRFRDCVDFCTAFDGKFEGRLRTMLAPGQIDTCDPELLRDTRRVADAHRLPIQVHAGQSPNEYARIRSEYGMSTVEYMASTGMLGPDCLIGHGQVMTADGDMASLTPNEVAALRDSQTTVAHLPWVKARRGGVINSIHKYRQLGIRQSLGTDTFPFDMFNDMRMAATICRIVEHSVDVAPSREVYAMATVGGADGLGRPDLGRLAPGCKADIIFVRVDTFKAAPTYDPFMFLVLSAGGDDVERVMVDGKTVVENGKVLNVDMAAAVGRLNAAAVARARERALVKQATASRPDLRDVRAFSERDIAAAAGVVLIWGLNFVAMKFALREFTPFQLGTFRYLFAALPFVLWVPTPKLPWGWVLAAGLAQLGQFGLLFLAMKLGMTAAIASVLMQTQMFFTALLGVVLLGERLGGPARAGLGLAAAGLGCFALNFLSGRATGGISVPSLALNLGAALMWAASNVVARRAQAAHPDYDALPFVTWMSLVPILPFAALAWRFEPAATRWHWLHASAVAWLAVAYLGVFATIVAYASWTWLLKRHAANRVAPFSLGVPVIGLAAGMLTLGETVSPWQWGGSLCVVAALLAAIFGGRWSGRTAAGQPLQRRA